MTEQTTFGPFCLDRSRRQLTRGGHVIPIGHRGYLLIAALLEAGGEAVSKDVLMERVWPGTAIEEGSLTVQISALRRQLGEGAGAMIVTVPRIGYRLVRQAEISVAQKSGLPLIAVLPFAQYGDGVDDGYFVDGIADDIITALSRFKAFAVLSRSSSFALRDRGEGAVAAAVTLGVRYALEGSVRRMAERLRVTAQLIDASSGTQLWAERYDGALADVFSFQDRITENVVAIIEPTIRKAEIERVRRKPAANLDAYDLFLKALPLFYAPGPEGHANAMALFHRSAALDPSFASPRAYAAWIYERRISMRHPPLGNNDRQEALDLARSALAQGGGDPLIIVICAWVLFRLAGDPTAVQAVRRALEDNPNHVLVLHLATAVLGMAGLADEAFKHNLRAYELSPSSPESYQFLQGIGAAELQRGNNEEAIGWCLKSLATFNDWLFTYITLVAAYVNLDRMDEARSALQRVRELHPTLTMRAIEDDVAQQDGFADAVIPGLRKAGLPEC
ncbi:MAG: winged helix-turn-helix domain-containing protein [Devosia sp.]